MEHLLQAQGTITSEHIITRGRVCPGPNVTANTPSQFQTYPLPAAAMGQQTYTLLQNGQTMNSVVGNDPVPGTFKQYSASYKCTLPPVDCVYKTGNWGTCIPNSGTCGPGTQTQPITVVTPATGKGKACPGPQTQPCTVPCPVNCAYTWGNWGACVPTTGSCGPGTQTKNANVTTPAANGGTA